MEQPGKVTKDGKADETPHHGMLRGRTTGTGSDSTSRATVHRTERRKEQQVRGGETLLHIASLNVGGITGAWRLFNSIHEGENKNVDVWCIQEVAMTKVEAQAASRYLSKKGYYFHAAGAYAKRTEDEQMKGGVAMITRKELRQGSRWTQVKGHASVLAVDVEGLTVATVYAPPQDNHKRSLAELIMEVWATQWTNVRWIAIGDWNSNIRPEAQAGIEHNPAATMLADRANARILPPMEGGDGTDKSGMRFTR